MVIYRAAATTGAGLAVNVAQSEGWRWVLGVRAFESFEGLKI